MRSICATSTRASAGLRPGAGAVLAYNTAVELAPEELPLIAGARLLQFITAGIDFIPLGELPPGLPVAATPAPMPSRWPSTSWR